MAISAHSTARARTIRWTFLGAGGLAAAVAALSASEAARDARTASAAIAEIRERQGQHKKAADAIAVECKLRRFSDDASLDTFPMDLGRFQSKREAECARRVSIARADLIQDLVQLRNAVKDEARLGNSSRRRVRIAAVLVGGWMVALYLAEIRPRSRSASKGAAAGAAPREAHKGSAAPTGGVSG
jgi:hypothetical protein